MASGADEGRSVIGTDLSIRFRSRHVRLPAERLAILLQKLCREVRGSVLGRLEEWQRLELEQELLRKLKSGASFMKADEDRGKCALPTSPVATKPSEVIPPRPPKRPSQKVKRKVLCNARENQGIFRRQTAGGEKFRAGIGFCNLRLQARPRSSIRDARKDLDCLVGLRDQVLLHHGPFEDRVAKIRFRFQPKPVWHCNSPDVVRQRCDVGQPANHLTGGKQRPRRDRFLADVILDSGEQEVAYCVNPGRMEAFTGRDARIWLSPAQGVGRGS
eukprot:g6318.t1